MVSFACRAISPRSRRRRRKCEARSSRHKPPHGPLDVKLGAGGLVDLEFAVQVLQLTRHVGLHTRLEVALEELQAESSVPANIVDALKLLSRILVMMRLVAPGDVKPTPRYLAAGRRSVWCRRAGTRSLRNTMLRGRASAIFGNQSRKRREMIGEGDKAPAITVTASDGATINLAAPGQPLVVYFYPKDDTSGCTREAQDFTALAGRFPESRCEGRRGLTRCDEEPREVHRQVCPRGSARVRRGRAHFRSVRHLGRRSRCTAANIWGWSARPI